MKGWSRRALSGRLAVALTALAGGWPARGQEGSVAAGGERITGFGYKNAWLAIEGRDADRIIAALGLRDRGDIGWDAGLERAYEFMHPGYGRYLFITPPIDGWTLCVGLRLFEFAEGRGGAFAKLATRLSRDLDTTVQYFATHRIVDAHVWALARSGELVRAFSYVGESVETLVDIGPQTEAETSLGFAFFDERLPEAQDDAYWDRTDLNFPREYHVMALAAAWSLAPPDLQDRLVPSSTGRLAEF